MVVDEDDEIRPWGTFNVLADELDHKVKRLVVNPGQRLSQQYHMRRDEHWYFLSGTGKAIVDGHIHYISGRQTVEVKREQRHRIINDGTEPLVLIEVQTGEYFGEDDIVRTDDDYGRIPE